MTLWVPASVTPFSPQSQAASQVCCVMHFISNFYTLGKLCTLGCWHHSATFFGRTTQRDLKPWFVHVNVFVLKAGNHCVIRAGYGTGMKRRSRCSSERSLSSGEQLSCLKVWIADIRTRIPGRKFTSNLGVFRTLGEFTLHLQYSMEAWNIETTIYPDHEVWIDIGAVMYSGWFASKSHTLTSEGYATFEMFSWCILVSTENGKRLYL